MSMLVLFVIVCVSVLSTADASSTYAGEELFKISPCIISNILIFFLFMSLFPMGQFRKG